MEHRKSSLENLVKLLLQGYFAGPKMPRDLANEIALKAEKKQNTSKRIGSGLKRKKLKRKTDDQ